MKQGEGRSAIARAELVHEQTEHAMRLRTPGDELVTRIEGIGEMRHSFPSGPTTK